MVCRKEQNWSECLLVIVAPRYNGSDVPVSKIHLKQVKYRSRGGQVLSCKPDKFSVIFTRSGYFVLHAECKPRDAEYLSSAFIATEKENRLNYLLNFSSLSITADISFFLITH